MARGNADSSRDRLAEAAATLFRSRPPAEVSVREIAEAAGVNHGLVHRYFGGKDGLVQEVLRRVLRETFDAVSARLEQDLDGAVLQGLRILVRERWIVEVLAHVMLTRRSAEGLPPASMMPAVRRRLGRVDIADRAALAAVESAVLGWLLFEPLVSRGTGLDALEEEARLQAMARALAGTLRALPNMPLDPPPSPL